MTIREHLKEKTIAAFANMIVWGTGILITWAIFYAFLGKQEMQQISESLNIRMTKEFNDSVKRDAEIIDRMTSIERAIDQICEKVNAGRIPLNPKPNKEYFEKHYKEHVPIIQNQAK